MAITLEMSYVNADGDMGSAHVAAHENQHTWLQPGEQKIIEVTATDPDASSYKLALEKAQSQGLKTADEWQKYNAGLKKSRQKDSYEDYVRAASSNLTKNMKRKADTDPKMPRAKRDKLYQSLASIDRNKGIPIVGSLYYLGNADAYEARKNDPAALKQYRAFERTTLERFMKSDDFKKLHPGMIRAEIHQDELGVTHGQAQDVDGYLTGNGRFGFSQRAMVKDILLEKYGSEDALNKRLDLLSLSHKIAKKPAPDERVGTVRADALYWQVAADLHADTTVTPQSSAAERNTRLLELYRLENMKLLENTATATAKEMGVDWKPDMSTYQTDGRHLNRSAYQATRDAKAATAPLEERSRQLDKRERELDKREDAVTMTENKVAEHDSAYAAELAQRREAKRQAAAALAKRVETDDLARFENKWDAKNEREEYKRKAEKAKADAEAAYAAKRKAEKADREKAKLDDKQKQLDETATATKAMTAQSAVATLFGDGPAADKAKALVKLLLISMISKAYRRGVQAGINNERMKQQDPTANLDALNAISEKSDLKGLNDEASKRLASGQFSDIETPPAPKSQKSQNVQAAPQSSTAPSAASSAAPASEDMFNRSTAEKHYADIMRDILYGSDDAPVSDAASVAPVSEATSNFETSETVSTAPASEFEGMTDSKADATADDQLTSTQKLNKKRQRVKEEQTEDAGSSELDEILNAQSKLDSDKNQKIEKMTKAILSQIKPTAHPTPKPKDDGLQF